MPLGNWRTDEIAILLVQAFETDKDAFAGLRFRLIKGDDDLRILSQYFARNSFFAIATEITRDIRDEKERSGALREIAAAQANAGEAEAARATRAQALAAAQQIQHQGDQSTLREIAIAQAQAGQFTEALATAQSIEDSMWRRAALGIIVEVQAQVGGAEAARGTFTEAIAIAQQIEDSSQRISAER